MNFAVVFAIVAIAAGGTSARTVKLPKLPANHVACFRNDPEFDKCFPGSLQNLLRSFAQNGVPELGVESFDPFFVPLLTVEYEEGQINVKMSVLNSTTIAFGNIRIFAVRSNFKDPSKFEMEIDFQFPTSFLEGQYTAEGNLATLPFKGGGHFNLTMHNVTGTWKLSGIHITKKGLDYVKLEHFRFLPTVGSMKIFAENLLGNEALNSAALAFANAFWPALYKELLPPSAEAWDPIMAGFANRVFTRVPFDALFPVL